MSFPHPALEPLAQKVFQLLKSRKETVCFAETACGGIISSALLSVPGASSVFAGGLTLYTLPSRLKYAGWTQKDIDSYAGPNPELVLNLAKYVRNDLGATWCLGESGTAGPTRGATEPGYVALAVDSASGEWKEAHDTKSSNRSENMVEFGRLGLSLLLKVLEDASEKGSL